jgi:hypothetical protein
MSSEPTSEWDDIQRRLGNLPELPPAEAGIDEDELRAMVMAAANDKKKQVFDADLDGDSLSSDDEDLLAELLQGDDEQEAFEAYRRERMKQLQSSSGASSSSSSSSSSFAIFGRVREISRQEFTQQVTGYSNGKCGVLLYDERDESKLLAAALGALAERHVGAKFVKIQAQQCIANYPRANTPTLLIYENGDVVKQFVGLSQFGGRRMRVDDLEWQLAQLDDKRFVTTKLKENPLVADSNRVVVNIRRRTAQTQVA